jgi:hypothetical protein
MLSFQVCCNYNELDLGIPEAVLQNKQQEENRFQNKGFQSHGV